ncbi:MAG: DJ-1/PfpI family protein [Prevotella sp.]|nr:DJ-1/PfpI family protein [Prevotella sp.]
MIKVYEFLTTGFEIIEAMIPVDVMRRGGVCIKTVSLTGSIMVESGCKAQVKADMLFEDADFSDADLLMLPGGLPGAYNLNAHEEMKKLLLEQNAKGKMISAICAAPLVLGGLGLLKGKRATCYPSFEEYLKGAEYTQELCTVDGNITTGKGPAAAFPYAFTLLAALKGEDVANGVAEEMMYNFLMGK